ncbi:glycoside hydrolase family 3 C-terminal domain-containing protein [Phenylobacterium sp.]|uniref:glycoside hydrolase family 3 C-terminal domain-containing protein n=1 Tax=Phenylobacterium sp. TaxID=1871053 RepID=UPI0035682EAC
MSLDEKIGLVTGQWGLSVGPFKADPQARGGDGFAKGVARLGVPNLQLIGAGLGVTDLGRRANGPSTALPSTLALAASFDPGLSYAYGEVIGRETRQEGFNVSLGGAVNLTRDPRGGRAFEYHGEDPILAGKMIAPQLRAIQDQGVVATIKHFALNDQETDRFGVNEVIDERAMREGELLAFEIGIKESGVGAVMCSYNQVNGDYACENNKLLNRLLKGEWGFKGWVMSDWGGTHSTAKAINTGLDQEFFDGTKFGPALAVAVQAGEVPAWRLDDMVRRIVRSLMAVGAMADKVVTPIDPAAGAEVALRSAQEGSVLLKNNGVLPVRPAKRLRIAVIGLNADRAVMSGGGSSQVNPVGGNAIPPQTIPSGPLGFAGIPVWVSSSPVAALRARLPGADIQFDSGEAPDRAARLARSADVTIVFAGRRRTEGTDAPDLTLGAGQDDLIAAVADAHRKTVVVLETGGAVLMPWVSKVGAVLEAWYPGQQGGEAIADLLTGAVNPSGKLPLTFPASEADLPRAKILGVAKDRIELEDVLHPKRVDVRLTEGVLVGYKWFDAQGKTPLFPFGHGLSYTSFGYDRLSATFDDSLTATFSLTNAGKVPGTEVAQLYVSLPASTGGPPRRLAGWARVNLAVGEKRTVQIHVDPKALAIWDIAAQRWRLPAGDYTVSVGGSSRDLPLKIKLALAEARWVP